MLITSRLKYISISLLSYIVVCGTLLLTLAKVESDISITIVHYVYGLLIMSGLSILGICILKPRLSLKVIDLLIGLFLVYYAVNYLVVSHVDASTLFWKVILMGALYLNLRILLSVGRSIYYLIILTLAVCGFVEATIGITQVLGISVSNHSLFRTTGTFFNPGPYGGYLAVLFAVMLGYIVAHYGAFVRITRKRPLRLFFSLWSVVCLAAVICAISIFIILPSTLSRAAFVSSMVAGLAVFVNYSNVASRARCFVVRYGRLVLLWLIMVFMAVLCLGVGLYLLKPHSANGRLLMWKVSTLIIADNPICGVGVGAFSGNYAQYQAEYFVENPDSQLSSVAGCPAYAFNEYLQTGSELGLLGLSVLLSILIIALLTMLRRNNVFAFGLLAIMIFSFFSYPLSLLPFQILITLFVAVGASTGKKRIFSIHRLLAIVFLLGTTVSLLFAFRSMTGKVAAIKEYKSLGFLYRMEMYDDVVDQYAKIHPMLMDNYKFLFEYGHILNKLGRYDESNAVLVEGAKLNSDPMFYNVMGNNYKSLGEYDLAEQNYVQAYKIIPNRLYPLYLKMKLYYDSGQDVKAHSLAGEILKFDPKVVSSATADLKREAQEIFDELSQ